MNKDYDRNKSGLRDRNLAKEAPLAFCTYVLLQDLNWDGSNDELAKIIGDNPEKLSLVELRNKLLLLGFNSQQYEIRGLKALVKNQLPAIFVDKKNKPYIIYYDKVRDTILAKNYDGIIELKDIDNFGILIQIQKDLIKILKSNDIVVYQFNYNDITPFDSVDIKLKQDSLCEKKNFHKIFRYCKNENLVDWFIDDSTVHDDFELRNLLKFPKLSQTN